MKYAYSGEELRKSDRPEGTPPSSLVRGETVGGKQPPANPQGKGRNWEPFVALGVLALLGIGWGLYDYLSREPSVSVVITPPPLIWYANDGGEKVEVSRQSAKEYLTPTAAEMNQLYNYVIESPFVRTNPTYYKRVSPLDVYYIETNDVVNAGATRRVIEEDGKKDLVYATEIYGGAVRYARLVGLAAALQNSGKKEALKDFVALMPKRMCGRCSEKDALALIEKGGLVPVLADAALRQKAISYSSGTIVSVIAHEMGHHALGHMTGFDTKTNLEIARNQEREADSFASSVISSSPFGEYVFAGTLFWHYAVAMQADGESDLKDNHPLSKERFENFVRANAEKAAAMGIVLSKK